MSGGISTKIDLQYADRDIVFGIAHCCSDKKHSFWKLERVEVSSFLDKLRYVEKMTWKQFSALPRENGLTPEIQGSKTFSMIDSQDTREVKLVEERHYFHFRVKNKNLFRVFGYQHKNIFYITHLDPKGKLQH